MLRIAVYLSVLTVLLAVQGNAELIKLAVLHRHGARSGSSLVDGQVGCEYPFCQLTSRGIDQLKAVGRYINATYGYLLPSQYNVSYITSISTAVPRVVVSAESFIMGIYEGQEPLPFIQFDPDNVDTMLSMWNSVPSFLLQDRYSVAVAYANPITAATLSPQNISYLANLLGLNEMCVTQNSPFSCVEIAVDNYECNYTNGIPVDPTLTAMMPSLKPLVANFLNFLMGYQPSAPNNNWSSEVGSLGYTWAQDLIEFFETPFADNSLTTLKHYAAHDSSLAAFYGAVGYVTEANAGDPSTIPQFAQTVVFELHSDVVGQLSIVPKIGYPTEEPTIPINFALEPMAILCTFENGTNYDGSAGCPLADFARYVSSTAPKAADGQCYYTPAMMEAAGCLGTGMPSLGSSCLFYRQSCPQTPCALTGGSVSDPRTGYACSTLQEADDPPYFAATVAALVAPSILAGAIVGFYSAGAIRRRLYKDTDEERQPIVSN